jgi:hypothetical protein
MVKADFAATVILKSEYMATCEHGRYTNMYVALVLHSPEIGPLKQGVGEFDCHHVQIVSSFAHKHTGRKGSEV